MLYWIIPCLLWLGSQGTDEAWWLSVLLTALIVLVLERQLYSYSVLLFPDHLIYRDRGYPWPREYRFDLKDIVGVERKTGVRLDGVPWDSLRVRIRRGSASQEVAISLVTFARADVDKLTDWLSHNELLGRGAS